MSRAQPKTGCRVKKVNVLLGHGKRLFGAAAPNTMYARKAYGYGVAAAAQTAMQQRVRTQRFRHLDTGFKRSVVVCNQMFGTKAQFDRPIRRLDGSNGFPVQFDCAITNIGVKYDIICGLI